MKSVAIVARLIALLMCFATTAVWGQLRALSALADPELVASISDQDEHSDSASRDVAARDLRLGNTLLVTGGAALVGIYGAQQWWQDGFTGNFRSTNEGWFEQDTPSGGADKLGHAFFAYAGTRLLARGFESLGNAKSQANKWGFWSSLGVMMGVEILDGFSKQYQFSPQDAVMNVIGAGMGYAMEAHPELDRLIDFRLLYKPSTGHSFDPGGDYSGQTYLFVLKANAFPVAERNPLLRYVEFAVGYGTRNYGDVPYTDAQRNLYAGLSLNLSEVLNRSVFRGGTSYRTAQRLSDLFLEFVQVPGTAALLRNRL